MDGQFGSSIPQVYYPPLEQQNLTQPEVQILPNVVNDSLAVTIRLPNISNFLTTCKNLFLSDDSKWRCYRSIIGWTLFGFTSSVLFARLQPCMGRENGLECYKNFCSWKIVKGSVCGSVWGFFGSLLFANFPKLLPYFGLCMALVAPITMGVLIGSKK